MSQTSYSPSILNCTKTIDWQSVLGQYLTASTLPCRLQESLMSSLFQTLQQQKQRILDIAGQYHAVNVRVFGSVIRGEEREDSDIDLLVDFLPGTTLLDQVGLSLALSDALKRKVDIVSERGLNKHLCQRILQEAVPL